MARKNHSPSLRRSYDSDVRESERDRRRKRLQARQQHPTRNVKKESYPYAR